MEDEGEQEWLRKEREDSIPDIVICKGVRRKGPFEQGTGERYFLVKGPK